MKVLQPILVLGCTPDTQSVQGHLFSDDTRCRPQQFLVEEIAKENHSNCTNPLNLIAFLPFVVIPHNTVHTNANNFPYTSANGAVDLNKAALSRVF